MQQLEQDFFAKGYRYTMFPYKIELGIVLVVVLCLVMTVILWQRR